MQPLLTCEVRSRQDEEVCVLLDVALVRRVQFYVRFAVHTLADAQACAKLPLSIPWAREVARSVSTDTYFLTIELTVRA